MAEVPQDVQDAVNAHGDSVLVEVADEAIALTFGEAIKLGYDIIRLAVNSAPMPSPSPSPSPSS